MFIKKSMFVLKCFFVDITEIIDSIKSTYEIVGDKDDVATSEIVAVV